MPTIRDIDASELALVLDRPLADWTADSLRECYLRHGCVIVRGAIAPALIEQVRLAIDKAYADERGSHRCRCDRRGVRWHFDRF